MLQANEDLQRLLLEKVQTNKGLVDRVKALEQELLSLRTSVGLGAMYSPPTTSPQMLMSQAPSSPYATTPQGYAASYDPMLYANFMRMQAQLAATQGVNLGYAPILPKPSAVSPGAKVPSPLGIAESLGVSSKKGKHIRRNSIQSLQEPLRNNMQSPNLNAQLPSCTSPHSFNQQAGLLPTFMHSYVLPQPYVDMSKGSHFSHIPQVPHSSSVSLYSHSPDQPQFLDDFDRIEALKASSISLYSRSPNCCSYLDEQSERGSLFSVSQLDLNELTLSRPLDGNDGDRSPQSVSPVVYQSEFYFNASPASFEEDMGLLDQLLNTDPYTEKGA